MTAQTTYRTPEAPELPTRPLLLWSAIPLLLLLLGAALFFCAWVFNQRMEGFYRDRVYPHVSSLGVDLGGMTREEARQALLGAASNAEIGALTLRDGARQWVWPWTDAGLMLDVEGTLENVWAAGRAETPLREQLQLWLDPRPWEVAPRFTLDLAQTRQALERLSAEVSTPPVQPQLALENGSIIVIPGTPGRVLDVTALLGQIQTQSAAGAGKMELDLLYRDVPPTEPDITDVQTQAEALLNRQVTLSAFDVLTEQTLTWTLGRQEFISWLRLVARADGTAAVEADPAAVLDTLKALAAQLGDGRGFRLAEAAQQVWDAYTQGGGHVTVYLTHPERLYTVQAGDTVGRIAAKLGMPPGLIMEANQGVDLDHLWVGQQLFIPSQDVLTPNLPVPHKKIVVSIPEQRVRVYENGALLWDWPVSTGMANSPTATGVFQVLSKEEEAYASQWDLRMPYFLGVYVAGGNVTNGFHELPILKNGQRLWAGNLGRPASFGCIILGIPEAETLYNWAEIGVPVIIQ